MDVVSFHFRDPETNLEVVRTYEVSTLEEASKLYRLEFPDDSTRPRLSEIKVEHVKPKNV